MSYKPDESTLVAYLYNELNSETRAKVEAYLKDNPEVLKEIEEIKSMRKLMGKWQDKDIDEPTFVFDNKKLVVVSQSGWLSGILKTSIGIAASISFLMAMAYFSNLNISNTTSGIQISFGEQKEAQKEEVSPITEENIKTWLAESVANNNAQLVSKINETEQNLSEELTSYQLLNNRAIAAVKNNSNVDESLLQEYVVQLNAQNKEILLDLITSTENSQRQYVNEIMSDYSLYLEEQRQNDLQMIQTSFNGLKDNTEVSQIETNQILASIITTVNNQNN